MVIFHSYVKLPEGMTNWPLKLSGDICGICLLAMQAASGQGGPKSDGQGPIHALNRS